MVENMKKDNISFVVKNNLCVGCGICEDVCSTHKAITIVRTATLHVPEVDQQTCNNCGLCLNICPGAGIALHDYSEKLFSDENILQDTYIGRYLNCYSGYSNDYDIRYHSASGGLVTQFLVYLLEKKIIDGAVVVGFQDKDVTAPKVYIAENKKDVLQGKSSKYCPVSYNSIVPQLKERGGKYVVVGLPCHIHAFRKYENIHNWLQEKVLGYFSIYCSGTKNFLSQDFLFQRFNIDKPQLKKFAYRDDGCLGFMRAEYNDDSVKKINYLDYYRSMRGFFTPVRCTLCTDYYGELADVCFGDIHVGEYRDDKVGVNSLVVRSPYFKRLLIQAQSEGSITLNEIDKKTVNDSQLFIYKHKKGPGIATALKLRKMLGKTVPEYDVDMKLYLKFKYVLREIQNAIFRVIGKTRSLWFMIHWLDIITSKNSSTR
ncbi:Coenzyme F420 hydrogenase/dehydrogenase, beta subunit C-terminal domain [Desulfogranum japonicum]|uniref:Coenzyme F420 hydrogenase/dehydrogenase, beta subunit C-terminal domain n=1 Tax=Desulfogranum japonicum TaxID=231447 RepID=UPI0003F736A3|nr:Coenzyme F420 hydrogenase/dehydrogenase, beta subunit C-terminal domain [Desulfogranum japonicum]